jgi:hypothetical protein
MMPLLLAACGQGPSNNGLADQVKVESQQYSAAAPAGEAANAAPANVSAGTVAPPAVGAPLLGSCHGGECSWSRTESRAVVRQEASGILYRLSVLGGSAPEGEDAAVSWQGQPHDVFVFCSPRLPAVILPVDHGLQVDVLDFVAGPSEAYESSANLYADTCHAGEDWESAGFANRHGYQAQDAEREIHLSRPEDIFQAIR